MTKVKPVGGQGSEPKLTKSTLQSLTYRLQKAMHTHTTSELIPPKVISSPSARQKSGTKIAAVKVSTPNASQARKQIPLLSLTKLSPNESGRANPSTFSRPRAPATQTASENTSLNNSASLLLNHSHVPQQTTVREASTRATERKEFEFTTETLPSPRSAGKGSPRSGELAKSSFDSLKKPITASTTLRLFPELISQYEQGEILEYQDVFYLGIASLKPVDPPPSSSNFGFDDDRGDYKTYIGDHIAYRYEVLETLGKGSFGQVFRVLDHKTLDLLALKIIRNKSRFHHQAVVEVKILRYLRDKDTRNEFNVVHMKEFFVFRKHLCITFEMLNINLYDFIKSNGFQGVSGALVRRFAGQILACLQVLKKLRIIHCDLKPENILLKHHHKSSLKVIDFGSSCFEEERIYTYIQSRFYRAPEVILGLPYTAAIDMWSFGCILAELSTGVPLFPGESEHEQLLCIMELKGVPPGEMLEQATRRKIFFEATGEPRILTNKRGKRRIPGTKSLEEAVAGGDSGFVDFLQRMG